MDSSTPGGLGPFAAAEVPMSRNVWPKLNFPSWKAIIRALNETLDAPTDEDAWQGTFISLPPYAVHAKNVEALPQLDRL